MGAWGFGILENDDSLDVHGQYMDLYNAGTPVEVITKTMYDNHQVTSDEDVLDDSSNFWLGLAQAQWECRALDGAVLERVEQIVRDDIDQATWEESDYPERRTALKQFLAKIRKAKKTPKKRVPPKLFEAPYNKGDCVAIQRGDGRYGGVLCLGASEGRKRHASNVLALLRIDQRTLPGVDDFLNSHILVKNSGRPDDPQAGWAAEPEPAIDVMSVGTVDELALARNHVAVGNVDVQKTFGEVVYGLTTRWDWNDEFGRQLSWEETHPEIAADLSFPVRDFIRLPKRKSWAALGERFAKAQRDMDGYAEEYELSQAFVKQSKSLWFATAGRVELFIARYAGCSRQRANNRLSNIFYTARRPP